MAARAHVFWAFKDQHNRMLRDGRLWHQHMERAAWEMKEYVSEGGSRIIKGGRERCLAATLVDEDGEGEVGVSIAGPDTRILSIVDVHLLATAYQTIWLVCRSVIV